MLKTLSFIAVFAVCSFQLNLASAQTTNRQSAARATHLDNPLIVSGEIDRQSVSSDAIVEAKRLHKEGVKYSRAGLFTQAVELFKRSLKLKPDYADAYQSLGQAYYNMGLWVEAIQPLRHALALDPTDKDSRRRIAQAQLMLERETGRSDEKSTASRAKPEQPSGAQVPLNLKSLPSTASTTPAVSGISTPANEMSLTTIYLAGPGDVLDVRLDVRPALRSREPASPASTLLTVTSSGFLEHPLLADPVPVAGLKVEEISFRLEEELSRRGLVENPKVSVEVHEYVSHAILVSGLVKEPGAKILRREAIPLYVVVADAQPLPEASRVSLVRNKSNEVFTIDLAQPAEMNLLVHSGDVITLQTIPTQFFYVAGEVKSPGEKTFRRGLTLTQAIIAAGGLTGKSMEVRLARDDGKGFLVVSRYKLKAIDSGKIPDPLIQAGDRITIVN